MADRVIASRMEHDPCDCGPLDGTPSSTHTNDGQYLGGSTPLDDPLPEEIQHTLGILIETDRIETLRGWTDAISDWVGEEALSIDDLCLTDEETDHWGSIEGDRYHFRCFFDVVILAAIEDEPIELQTTNPWGTTISGTITDGEISEITPESAVFSFGVNRAIIEDDDLIGTHEAGYRAICPYVHAFESKVEYFAWAATADAPTVAMSIDAASSFATALAP